MSDERARPRLGRRRAAARPTGATCPRSIAASSSATGSSRRSGRAAGDPTELAEHLARLHRSAAGLDIALPDDVDERLAAASTRCSPPTASTGPMATPPIRITVSRGAYRSRGVLPPDEDVAATLVIQAWPVVAAPPVAPGARPAPRRSRRPARPAGPAGHAQDHVARRVRLRPARGAPGRRRRRAVPDDRRPPVGGDAAPTSSSSGSAADGGARAGHALARLRDPARHDPLVAARLGGDGSGCGPSRARLTARRPRERADEAFLSLERGRGPARDPVRGRARSATASPGPWTLRARADREAMIHGADGRPA